MTENALFMRRKYLGPECFRFKKFLDPKKYRVPKNTGPRKIFGLEIFGSGKFWVPKNFRSLIILVLEKF